MNTPDSIPGALYPLINAELAQRGIAAPVVLTREYLNSCCGNEAISGSSLNPLIAIDLPENMLMSYGNAIFGFRPSHNGTCGFAASPVVVFNKLDGAKLYLYCKGGYFRHVAVVRTAAAAAAAEWDQPVTVEMTAKANIPKIHATIDHGSNVDTLTFHTHFYYILDGKQLEADVSDDTEYQHLIHRLRFLPSVAKAQKGAGCSILTCYVSQLLRHPGHQTAVPMQPSYGPMLDLYSECMNALLEYKFIEHQFEMALEMEDPNSAMDSAKVLSAVNGSQLLRLCHLCSQVSSWDPLWSLVEHGVITNDQKRYIVMEMMQNQRGWLRYVPDMLFLQLYNWRRGDTTEKLRHLLQEVNRPRLARQLETAPFQPSKLRYVLQVQ